ncbi:MAG: hypothetical protein LBI90_00130 [Treponema sp.]|jgi:predicted small secreted protein|nr:hypothetical protein [Treponema sp.]
MKRNIFTKSLVLLLRIITIVALTGFSLAGCKTDAGDGGDGGGDIPSELVAIWYFDFNGNGVVDEGEDITPAYEFKADGTLLVAGVSGYSFTVNGDKITLVAAGVAAADSITFKIEGKKLTLNGSQASGFVAGNYAKK